MALTAIYCKSKNGFIGKDNKLLFNIPEDLQFFKKTTENHVVVMGRKTWESLPDKFKPLPNRTNIVLSRNKDLKLEGAEVFTSIEDAIYMYANKSIFFIGGEDVYSQAMPYVTDIIVTVVDKEADGDTKAPTIPNNFTVHAIESFYAVIDDVVTNYKRIRYISLDSYGVKSIPLRLF